MPITLRSGRTALSPHRRDCTCSRPSCSRCRAPFPPAGHVVELGIGPAYLAEYLLATPAVHPPTKASIIRSRCWPRPRRVWRGLCGRLHLQQAESAGRPLERRPCRVRPQPSSPTLGAPRPGRDRRRRPRSIAPAHSALPQGGLLLNGDFVKPEGTPQPLRARSVRCQPPPGTSARGRLLPGSPLWDCGKKRFEAPTPSQNYACLLAVA